MYANVTHFMAQDDSSLECTDHLRMCHASNIFIDLSTAGLSHSTNP